MISEQQTCSQVTADSKRKKKETDLDGQRKGKYNAVYMMVMRQVRHEQ